MATEVRIDKWLWAARIYKTRTIAAEACKKGRVSLAGTTLKPSRTIKVGDVIDIKKAPITWSFKVLQAIDHRVGAKLVPEVWLNVTTPEQLKLLEISKLSGYAGRAKGTGRPTKKDRRSLVDFSEDVNHQDLADQEAGLDFEFDFDKDEM
ncbi:MAG: RNA-binding S4 domain-containing protein [Bacteroidota bacterium]|nr:RNA-binding S4 domain-containing protein [Bacteroidota bacterium]